MKKKIISVTLVLIMAVSLFSVTTLAVAASPTSLTVLVNGKNVALNAYNIGGNNFFKLRDLASTLNGTPKQFEVGWDAANNAISLTSGKPYTSVGDEMEGKDSESKEANPTTSKIYRDGKEIQLAAYNIGGNNYFKLRDIGEAFDFGLDWDQSTQSIKIDTSKGYTPEEGSTQEPEVTPQADQATQPGQHLTSRTVPGVSMNGAFFYYLLKEGRQLLTVDFSSRSTGGTGRISVYDADDGHLIKAFDMPYEIFGECYEANNGNYYIAYGSSNPNMDDNLAVFIIVKYDENWNVLGQVSAADVYTKSPYSHGASMSESNGSLVLLAGRMRYDGHQSNFMMEIDSRNMSLIRKYGEPFPSIHVSHSLGQFVRHDGARIIRAEHGDGYPRGFYLWKHEGTDFSGMELLPFIGDSGITETGASAGGLEISDNAYLFVGNSIVQEVGSSLFDKRNAFLIVVPKDAPNSRYTQFRWLTDNAPDGQVSADTPYLIKMNQNKFVILWDESADGKTQKTHYIVIDGRGNVLGQDVFYGAHFNLRIKPITDGERIMWLAEEGGRNAVIYTLIPRISPGGYRVSEADDPFKKLADRKRYIIPATVDNLKSSNGDYYVFYSNIKESGEMWEDCKIQLERIIDASFVAKQEVYLVEEKWNYDIRQDRLAYFGNLGDWGFGALVRMRGHRNAGSIDEFFSVNDVVAFISQ